MPRRRLLCEMAHHSNHLASFFADFISLTPVASAAGSCAVTKTTVQALQQSRICVPIPAACTGRGQVTETADRIASDY